MDYSNIPTGLKITSQIPLNVKEWCKNEATLAYLGVDDNLAYTYHEGLRVVCIEEKTVYQWREVQPGEENTGLVPVDFTYPSNLPETYNINYSGKTYNFFKETTLTVENLTELVQINNIGAGAEVYKDSTTVGNNIQFNLRTLISSDDSISIDQTSEEIDLKVSPTPTPIITIQSSNTVSVTGAGTISNPYVFEVENPQKEIIVSQFPYTVSDNEDKHTIFLDNETQNVIVYVPEILKPGFTCSFIQKGTGDVIITGNGLDATNVITPSNLQNVIKGQAYGCFLEKEFNTPNYYLVGGLKLV